MNPHDLLIPLVHQLERLTQIVRESPYLSRDGRKGLEQDILEFSEKLKEGMLTLPQGEKRLADLNKKAAVDEIASLLAKIGQLNPSSPRLKNLRDLSERLSNGEISPDQARQGVQDLMG